MFLESASRLLSCFEVVPNARFELAVGKVKLGPQTGKIRRGTKRPKGVPNVKTNRRIKDPIDPSPKTVDKRVVNCRSGSEVVKCVYVW